MDVATKSARLASESTKGNYSDLNQPESKKAPAIFISSGALLMISAIGSTLIKLRRV